MLEAIFIPGSAQLQVSFIMDGPAQPLSLFFSAKAVQFLCLTSLATFSPSNPLRWFCPAVLIRLGFPGHQLCLGLKIPQHHLEPPSPRCHLSPPTHWLRLGSMLPQLHRGLSSLRLHWGPLLLWLCFGLQNFQLCLNPLPLWLSWAPPSLWFRHCP